MPKLVQVRKTKLNYLTVFVPRPLLVGLLVSKRSILISLQPTCWVNEDHRPLGKHFLEVCLSYFSQNSEYWNPVKHTEMNCNDLYSCRVTSYFVQGPYGSLLSAEINGTTCFTPGRGGRGPVQLELAKGAAWDGSFCWMAERKTTQSQQWKTKATACVSPLPRGGAPQSTVPSVNADVWSCHSPAMIPRTQPLVEHSYCAAECQSPFWRELEWKPGSYSLLEDCVLCIKGLWKKKWLIWGALCHSAVLS